VSPLGNIQASTDGTQEAGQTLDLSLIRHTLVVDELLDTLVHNTLCQHTQLVQLTNELDETETTTLGSGGSVVLVGHHGGFFGLALGLRRQVNLPATLEFLLATVEQVLAEEAATGNDGAGLVADALILDLRAHGLKHALAELGVNGRPVGFVGGLLEGELNDLPQGTAIVLCLGLRHDLQDLTGDTLEILGGHLVQSSLDLTLHHVRRHVGGGSLSAGGLYKTARLPAGAGALQGLDFHAGGERHALGHLFFLLGLVLLSTLAVVAGVGAVGAHTR